MTYSWRIRTAGCITLMVVAAAWNVGASPQRPAGARQGAVSMERAFVQQYCLGCHNDRAKTGGLALNALDAEHPERNPEVWEKVLRKLRARAMPPAGQKRPDEREYESVVSHLETSLDRAAADRPNPGRTEALRRLNRTEYQNAIRDLLGIEIDAAAFLPKEDASHGFDNVNVVGLSPTLMDRYLAAAQKISRLAVGTPVLVPGGETYTIAPDVTQDHHVEGLPFGTRGGTIVRHHFASDGQYEIQIRLARDRNEQIEGLTEPHQLEVRLDGTLVRQFTLQPQPRGGAQRQSDYYDEDKGDAGLKLRLAIQAGPRELGVTFVKRPSSQLETERKPYMASFNMDRHPRTQPAVYQISILGPFDPTGSGDTPSRRRIFVCRPAQPSEETACARRIISTLARRAYRRAVTDADIREPLAFYEQTRAEEGFEAGIEMALRAILVSPDFLFCVEQNAAGVAPNTAYRISDVELASRLSFFVWSSIPDDELLDLAIRGRLRDRNVLERQVRRMLQDPRSEALIANFAGQWLHLRNLAAVSPDPRLFPDFDDNLRQAFRRETELFFGSIVGGDRSLLELLSADYTFVNERLAKHYGIANVYGSHFRRVRLGETDVRRGLLGHGSVLTVTSYATRTSPVLRGKWILENILGSPPPPPPPNVPPLRENTAGSKVLTMREAMAQHRASPACSGCHQLMDPAGLSMENFDAVGRWRARSVNGEAIDVSGALPGGVTFEGVSGLRQALLRRPELFAATVTEKLLTYALGRELEYYDAPSVRDIVRDAARQDFRFSSVVLGIVESIPFQMRRSQ